MEWRYIFLQYSNAKLGSGQYYDNRWIYEIGEFNCYTYISYLLCLFIFFYVSLVTLLLSLFYFFHKTDCIGNIIRLPRCTDLNRHSNPRSRLNEKVLSAILFLATLVIPRSSKIVFLRHMWHEKKGIKRWGITLIEYSPTVPRIFKERSSFSKLYKKQRSTNWILKMRSNITSLTFIIILNEDWWKMTD